MTSAAASDDALQRTPVDLDRTFAEALLKSDRRPHELVGRTPVPRRLFHQYDGRSDTAARRLGLPWRMSPNGRRAAATSSSFGVVRGLPLLLLALCGALTAGQEVSTEYRVKAAFLYQFLNFVDWPEEVSTGPITMCVAGRNPFGSVLEETVRGETVRNRPIRTRVILSPEPGCDVIFIPRGAAMGAYLRAAAATPALTVGESQDFIASGGMINFVIEGDNVRFQINPAAAARAGVQISSRLLQIAYIVQGGEE
jgi:hypothetical protein